MTRDTCDLSVSSHILLSSSILEMTSPFSPITCHVCWYLVLHDRWRQRMTRLVLKMAHWWASVVVSELPPLKAVGERKQDITTLRWLYCGSLAEMCAPLTSVDMDGTSAGPCCVLYSVKCCRACMRTDRLKYATKIRIGGISMYRYIDKRTYVQG